MQALKEKRQGLSILDAASLRRKPESRARWYWIPACAGMTGHGVRGYDGDAHWKNCRNDRWFKYTEKIERP
jgi:hypothetical protein